MDESTPPAPDSNTQAPAEGSPSTIAGHVSYLTCSVDVVPCPAEAQRWTLVDPYAPPTAEQMLDQGQQLVTYVFVPFIVIAFIAWSIRQIVDSIE